MYFLDCSERERLKRSEALSGKHIMRLKSFNALLKLSFIVRTLFNFIDDCHKRNIRVVLIRHGIGIKNKSQPGILKSYTNKWLQEIPAVLAFHSALKHHGGSGATYVMIKKSDEKKHENREIHSKRS